MLAPVCNNHHVWTPQRHDTGLQYHTNTQWVTSERLVWGAFANLEIVAEMLAFGWKLTDLVPQPAKILSCLYLYGAGKVIAKSSETLQTSCSVFPMVLSCCTTIRESSFKCKNILEKTSLLSPSPIFFQCSSLYFTAIYRTNNLLGRVIPTLLYLASVNTYCAIPCHWSWRVQTTMTTRLLITRHKVV